eukprot:TRINITY_DN4327_c0_g1_i1.p1 TRINITY_DN4327_c0_g1~~TRINITY_DN4327_c0_g1_i1.p1  ORF type:complete len:456 (+),score=72.59 TRINITY_DN4327_c0_g1_i1:89-1456(+)
MGNRGSSRNRVLRDRDSIRIALEASLYDAPLPFGFEQATSPKGQVYFIDHHTGTTTFNDPRLTPSQRRRAGKKPKGRPPKYVWNFYSKVQHMRSKLHSIQDSGTLDIVIKRDDLIASSIAQNFHNFDSLTLTRRLHIKYEGEPGLDYGGMSREWFLSLSKELLSEDLKLFKKEGYRYRINPNSAENKEHLEMFYFFGVIMGMAIYHGYLLHSYFTLPFYKAMLGEEITLEDYTHVDENMYKSMKAVSQTDNVEDFYLSFSVTEVKDGEVHDIELKKGGSSINVTKENRDEYLKLIVDYHLYGAREQMKEILRGLHQLISPDIIKMFTAEELATLIGGTETIDVEDLINNTEYSDLSPSSTNVLWLWQAVKELSQKELKRFLHFVTGTTKVPIGGFNHLYGSTGPQKFTVMHSKRTGLPTAHSCFNRLELPEYASFEELKKNLLFAIKETQGFGLE